MESFRITGLPAALFSHLYDLDDTALAAKRVVRYTVDANPGSPDRIEMRDLEIGERALLLNYAHQDADTPYRSSHAIFVREGATRTFESVDDVPDVLRVRALSLRGFDAAHMLLDADLVAGSEIEDLIERLFTNPAIAYIQAHYAKRGCYAARIDRNRDDSHCDQPLAFRPAGI